jgi:hypothetical protein
MRGASVFFMDNLAKASLRHISAFVADALLPIEDMAARSGG